MVTGIKNEKHCANIVLLIKSDNISCRPLDIQIVFGVEMFKLIRIIIVVYFGSIQFCNANNALLSLKEILNIIKKKVSVGIFNIIQEETQWHLHNVFKYG